MLSSATENKTIGSQQLAEIFHKQIIKKFEKRKIYSSFKDNIWDADLADMQLINKCNERICFS